MKRVTVSARQADRLRAELARFIGCRVDREDSFSNIKQAARSALPGETTSLLSAMTAELGPSVVLVQSLLAEADLPPTPKSADSATDTELSLLSEVVLLGLATLLGEPLGYRAEKNGAIVQSVFPVEAERGSPSNESSSSILNLHTELVFSRQNPTRPLDVESPDFLLLWCLRCDPDRAAATLVTPIDDLRAGLGPSHLSILAEPRFENRAPYSFTRDMPDDRPWVGPVPILRSRHPCRAAFDLACGTRGTDADAESALDAMRGAAKRPGVIEFVHLRPGDVLILDNRRCAHGRTPFTARFDGSDRWLLRVYVRRSLAGMEPANLSSPRVF